MGKVLSIFKNMNISKKLIIFFLLLGIVPLIVATLLAYSKSSAALDEAAFNQLIAIRDIKKNQITEYFDRALLEMETFGRSKDVAILWDELVRYHVDTKVRPDGPYDVTTDRYREIWETYGHSLKRFLDDSGFYDIYVICVAHGHVMYTTAKEVDLGTNLRYGPYKESGLAKLREKVIEAKGKAVVDLEPYAPNNDEPAAFAGCPIHNAEGKFVGLMVVQMSLDQINAIMTQRAGLGETGETYLIGQDKLMRSDSYLDPVNYSVMASFANPDIGSVDTEAADEVIAGKTDAKIIIDYNGNPVLSAYTPVELHGITWGLLAQIDEAEALAAPRELLIWLAMLALIAAVIIAFLAFVISRSITRPIHNIAAMTKDIAVGEGDLTKKIAINKPQPCSDIMHCGHNECPAYGKTVECWVEVGSFGHDIHCPKIIKGVYKSCHECVVYKRGNAGELGELSNWQNAFIARLRHLITKVKANSEGVGNASTQISSASEQLAAGAEEQQAQLSEVATTMEQMSAMILEASKNADETRQNAQHTGTTATQGREVVSKTVSGFQTVAKTVEQAAKQIQELSKRSEEIGGVIQVIDDIADQTNLLALNANIEAARAGDAGRGFAVVADEVRKLAERTVSATAEIGKMIESIQADIQAAVVSMEQIQGQSKEGLELVAQSDKSLEEISGSITGVVSAVEQIATSSTEQSSGAEEISKNIEGVTTVAKESASSAQELAASAEQLNREVEGLNKLIGQFKV